MSELAVSRPRVIQLRRSTGHQHGLQVADWGQSSHRWQITSLRSLVTGPGHIPWVTCLRSQVTCLRSCLRSQYHESWVSGHRSWVTDPRSFFTGLRPQVSCVRSQDQGSPVTYRPQVTVHRPQVTQVIVPRVAVWSAVRGTASHSKIAIWSQSRCFVTMRGVNLWWWPHGDQTIYTSYSTTIEGTQPQLAGINPLPAGGWTLTAVLR